MKATRPQKIVIEGDKVKYMGLMANVISVDNINATATVKIVARSSRVSVKKPVEVNICDLVTFH